LLRLTQAHEAIQRRIADAGETSDERRKLENALEALNLLRDRSAYNKVISSCSEPMPSLGL